MKRGDLRFRSAARRERFARCTEGNCGRASGSRKRRDRRGAWTFAICVWRFRNVAEVLNGGALTYAFLLGGAPDSVQLNSPELPSARVATVFPSTISCTGFSGTVPAWPRMYPLMVMSSP